VTVSSRYAREIVAARERLANSDRRVAMTALGPVEYLAFGRGSPVLWVHGVVGGSDQGDLWARAFLDERFRIVAVSRFGYLGSPLLSDPSPSAQADLFAALLDELGIQKVAVVASSAGTSSAFRFALRHPARCTSLVVWSMAVPPYGVPPSPLRAMLRAFFGSDFLFWATLEAIRPIGRRLMGIPRDVERRLSPEDRRFAIDARHSLLPVSPRVDGIMNDICVSNPDLSEIYPLESLLAPALIIHAMDDPWGSFARAREIAARIPRVRFEGINSGGHLLLGSRENVRALMTRFIQENETD
jgi:pimeloyl-ACP methyl ester carboxylesterase